MADKPERTCVIPIHKPNLKEKTFFLLSGLLVSVPFALFLAQFYDFLPFFWSAVLFAPFIEELAKVYPLFYRHGETERSIVSLGILVGVGFGITELVLYVTLLGAPVVDRLSGVIFHASSAGITAYGISKKNPLPYYLLAVMLHSLNNLVIFSDFALVGIIAQVIIVIITFLLAWQFYYKASNEKVVV